MWTDAILAYLHFAAILTLVWFLAKEWTLLRAGAPNIDTERLAGADAGFGITAMLVLVTGGLRAVYGAKGWSFYAHNPAFHVKVTLFVIVGLVSIAPTIAFIRWRKARRASLVAQRLGAGRTDQRQTASCFAQRRDEAGDRASMLVSEMA